MPVTVRIMVCAGHRYNEVNSGCTMYSSGVRVKEALDKTFRDEVNF